MPEIWFENAGTRLFAVEMGQGPPVILLHGGLAAHLAALRFGAPLADRFRVIAPDLRASGRSIHHGDLSWDLVADDIAALVDHLGLGRAVIGGVSFGAGVAVRVALRHPRVTAALVVLHPAFDGEALTPAQEAAMAAMDAAGSRAPGEGIEALFPLVETLPEEMREPVRKLFATYDPASVAALTRFMASGRQPFERRELAAIEVPALVVPGVDATHPRAFAEVYRSIPRAQLVETADLASAIASFVSS